MSVGLPRKGIGLCRPRVDMPSARLRQMVEIAQRHGVRPAEMLKPTKQTRRRPVSRARCEFFAEVLGGERPPSASLVGLWFGFDHSTVVKGRQAHAKRMAEAAQ